MNQQGGFVRSSLTQAIGVTTEVATAGMPSTDFFCTTDLGYCGYHRIQSLPAIDPGFQGWIKFIIQTKLFSPGTCVKHSQLLPNSLRIFEIVFVAEFVILLKLR